MRNLSTALPDYERGEKTSQPRKQSLRFNEDELTWRVYTAFRSSNVIDFGTCISSMSLPLNTKIVMFDISFCGGSVGLLCYKMNENEAERTNATKQTKSEHKERRGSGYSVMINALDAMR